VPQVQGRPRGAGEVHPQDGRVQQLRQEDGRGGAGGRKRRGTARQTAGGPKKFAAGGKLMSFESSFTFMLQSIYKKGNGPMVVR